MLELQGLQPVIVGLRPARLIARPGMSVAQHECVELLARLLFLTLEVATRPGQVAHRFLLGIRNPSRHQVSGSQLPSQHQRIAPIRFDASPGLTWCSRRRYYLALPPQFQWCLCVCPDQCKLRIPLELFWMENPFIASESSASTLISFALYSLMICSPQCGSVCFRN